MSIQTELTRITNAKAAIKTAVEGKGVTVPDGTLLDGMAALIDSIEAGGGLNAKFGTFTPSTNLSERQTITHGLGVAPNTVIFFDASGSIHTTNNAVHFNAMIRGYGGIRCFCYSSRLTTAKVSINGTERYWGTGGANDDCCAAIQATTFKTPTYLGSGHKYIWIVIEDAVA